MNLLTAPLVASVGSVSEFWAATRAARSGPTIEQAITSGFQADRLGYAFLGGYAAALRALDSSLGPDDLGALCATEAGGGHPKAIGTTLRDGRLDGTKQFVSGGSLATHLLVIATAGTNADGTKQLKLARVNARAPGLTVEDLPPLAFVPEIPHGVVTFRATPVEHVFDGDGYLQALKPFRTIEDLHVFGAALGCLVRVGRRSGWGQGVIERLLAAIATVRQLASQPTDAPELHLALAGFLATIRDLVEGLDWSTVEPGEAERFRRDQPLLRVAETVREARRQKAWVSLSAS